MNTYTLNIPSSYKSTLEKIEKIVPVEVFRTNPIPCKIVSFNRNGLGMTVFPFNDVHGYVMVFQCQRHPQMVRDVYDNSMAMHLVFCRTDNPKIPWTVDLQISVWAPVRNVEPYWKGKNMKKAPDKQREDLEKLIAMEYEKVRSKEQQILNRVVEENDKYLARDYRDAYEEAFGISPS
jgi:hypothetical protein